MRRLLGLCLLLLPGLTLGQTAVKVYPTDTVQSACVMNAANVTCVVPLAGKLSAGFVVTATSSPSGITLKGQSSRDGTNWDDHPLADASTQECISSVPNASLATGYGKSAVLGNGDRYFRVIASAWTSGSATITVTATDAFGPTGCPGGVDRAWYTSGVVTATTLTQGVAAPAAGSYLIWGVVMSASVASTTTADQQLRIKSGTGTNCGTATTTVVECFAPANGGCALTFFPPIKATSVHALCYMHAATGSKSFSINYSLAL